MKITPATPEQMPPGANESTTGSLNKICADAEMDKEVIVDQLENHIAFFTVVLRGLCGVKNTHEFLTLCAEKKGKVLIFSEEELEAQGVTKESIH